MNYKGTLSIQEIGRFMGKSDVFVRESIKNGSLPIGCYVQKGEKASFYISPKRAYEWLGYEHEEDSGDDSFNGNDDGLEC